MSTVGRALVLAGHGSHLDPRSSAPVHALAAAVRACDAFDGVGVAFWKEEPQLSRAFDAVDARDITVVPIFISEGYFTDVVVPREMGLTGRLTCQDGRGIRYTRPIGSHPALADIVRVRAAEAGAGPDDAVAVLGHGTARHPGSATNVHAQAERLRARGAFAECVAVFLEQEPSMHAVLDLTSRERVIVVPLFVADGWHAGQGIPDELALDGVETLRGGRVIRYAAPVGTHPEVAGVVLALATEARTW